MIRYKYRYMRMNKWITITSFNTEITSVFIPKHGKTAIVKTVLYSYEGNEIAVSLTTMPSLDAMALIRSIKTEVEDV